MNSQTWIAAFACLSIGFSSFAQDSAKKNTNKKEPPAVSAEQRQKMADVHQQMADCLRSNKSMNECHNIMKTAAQTMGMGAGMCGDGHGMMGHHGKGSMPMHHEGSESTEKE